VLPDPLSGLRPKAERNPQLPSKAPYTKRFEDATQVHRGELNQLLSDEPAGIQGFTPKARSATFTFSSRTSNSSSVFK
jgi:hypothetical protein